jgi:hypothetical protein
LRYGNTGKGTRKAYLDTSTVRCAALRLALSSHVWLAARHYTVRCSAVTQCFYKRLLQLLLGLRGSLHTCPSYQFVTHKPPNTQILHFKAGDFSPERTVTPGKTSPFPPADAKPGAVGVLVLSLHCAALCCKVMSAVLMFSDLGAR